MDWNERYRAVFVWLQAEEGGQLVFVRIGRQKPQPFTPPGFGAPQVQHDEGDLVERYRWHRGGLLLQQIESQSVPKMLLNHG